MKGASTSNMKLGGHGVLDKKMKVKLGITTHHLEGLLDCVQVFGDLLRLHYLEVIGTLSLLLIIYLGLVGYIP